MEGLSTDLLDLARQVSDSDSTKAQEARNRVDAFVGSVASALSSILRGNQLPLREALPESVRAMLMSPNGKFLVMMHPRENIWDFPALARFIGELKSVDSHITGFPVTHMGTVLDLKRSFQISALFSLMAVCVLVWNDLRDFRETVLAMIPLLVGLTWTLGWMGMSGMDLNLVNFIAVPLLIGISVDSGVHILHRYREPAASVSGLGTTTTAVILTSMTSMFGFGSLMSSEHRGAQSLGLIMTVGCGLILFASLTILPALASFFGVRQAKAVGARPIRRRRAA